MTEVPRVSRIGVPQFMELFCKHPEFTGSSVAGCSKAIELNGGHYLRGNAKIVQLRNTSSEYSVQMGHVVQPKKAEDLLSDLKGVQLLFR